MHEEPEPISSVTAPLPHPPAAIVSFSALREAERRGLGGRHRRRGKPGQGWGVPAVLRAILKASLGLTCRAGKPGCLTAEVALTRTCCRPPGRGRLLHIPSKEGADRAATPLKINTKRNSLRPRKPREAASKSTNGTGLGFGELGSSPCPTAHVLCAHHLPGPPFLENEGWPRWPVAPSS